MKDKLKELTSRYLVMPQHSNPLGVLFGGVLMEWIDLSAAMLAEKYSMKNVATVHINEVSFKTPIQIGEHIEITARVISTGNTTMNIQVDVLKENPRASLPPVQATSATLIFVALDDELRPTSLHTT